MLSHGVAEVEVECPGNLQAPAEHYETLSACGVTEEP